MRARWPDARVSVHCQAAAALASADPASEPIDPYGARGWSADAAIGRPLGVSRALRRHLPGLAMRLSQVAVMVKRRDPRTVRRYLAAVRDADLVLVSGSGSLNDTFRQHAAVLLDTLDLAIGAGAVTALVGQGIGPMSDRRLRRHAASVLPRVDVISVREGVASLPLLRELGVPEDRIAVTGDDAIALAYPARPGNLGDALGVNLRMASYAEIGEELVRAVGSVVLDAARRLGAEVLPVPIYRSSGEDDDLATVRRMLRAPELPDNTATASDLLAVVARCRVVVSGSYHAAVLALSMGIPAVTVAQSDYYVAKFRGLAGQFGRACRVEVVSDPHFLSRLPHAIDDAWQTAEGTRAELGELAERQIALGVSAYDRLFQLVESRRESRTRQ